MGQVHDGDLPGSDGKETGSKRGDQVLASTGSDNGVVGTRHSGTVISCHHQHHLNELSRVGGKAATEPQEGEDTSYTKVLGEDLGDLHAWKSLHGAENMISTYKRWLKKIKKNLLCFVSDATPTASRIGTREICTSIQFQI